MSFGLRWRSLAVVGLLTALALVVTAAFLNRPEQFTPLSKQTFLISYWGSELDIRNHSSDTATELAVFIGDSQVPLGDPHAKYVMHMEPDGTYQPERVTPEVPVSLKPNESSRFYLPGEWRPQSLTVNYKKGGRLHTETYRGVSAP